MKTDIGVSFGFPSTTIGWSLADRLAEFSFDQ